MPRRTSEHQAGVSVPTVDAHVLNRHLVGQFPDIKTVRTVWRSPDLSDVPVLALLVSAHLWHSSTVGFLHDLVDHVASEVISRFGASKSPTGIEELLEHCVFPERGYCHTNCEVCLPKGHVRFDTRKTSMYDEGDLVTHLDFPEHITEGIWEVVFTRRCNLGTLVYDQIEIKPAKMPTQDELISVLDGLAKITEDTDG